jgi:TatD DNase family protein
MSFFIDIHTHHLPKNGQILALKNLHDSFENINPLFYYSAGLHPCLQHTDHLEKDEAMLKKCLRHDHVLMVGECGLDRLSDIPFPQQEKIFINHILLANEYAKPLIVHCVKAHRELIQLLKDYRVNVPVIFHGFNNKYEIAKLVLDQGYYLSFGRSINNLTTQNTFLKIPPNKILMETDDGLCDIESIYMQACRLRNIRLPEWQLQIRQNFSDIFPKLPA